MALEPAPRMCGNCNYSLIGLAGNQCPECSVRFDPDDIQTFNSTGRPLRGSARFLIRAPFWIPVVVALFILGRRLWMLRQPGAAMLATWYYGWYASCLLVFAIRGLQLLFRRIAEDAFGHREFAKRHRSAIPAWPLLLLIVVVSTVAAKSKLPMNWAFSVSRPSMDRLADQAMKGTTTLTPAAPVEVGLFHVSRLELLSPNWVVLYTSEKPGFWSKWGFARLPGLEEDSIDLDASFDPKKFHMQRATRISGDWYLLFDAYWAVKDGWS